MNNGYYQDLVYINSDELKKLKEENEKLKKAIEILKNYLMINVSKNNKAYILDANDYAIPYLNKKQYELLKEVLENVED